MNDKKRFIILTAIIALTAIMVGCGGSATKIVVVPEYKKHFAIDATLAVVMIDRNPQAIYVGDLKKSLGYRKSDSTAAEVLMWRHFRERLVNHLLREVDVKDAFMADAGRDYLVTKESVYTTDENITIEIPDVGTKIKLDGNRDASLIMFLDKVRVGTETDPYYKERAAQGLYMDILVPRKLVFVASFVLWDNRELKPICYGRVKTITPITNEEATSENWDEITREFVRKAFEPTGFRRRDDKGKM